MRAHTLMVQGTASAVGKSLTVTALCRIFHRRGIRVAPFKSQNMALNSFVTADGGEIGRAQAVQAEAAGIEPVIAMNPILLKPEAGMRSQVVIMGKSVGSMTYADYHERKPELCRIIADCLTDLRERYDLVVIEGAGSPAEINLRSRDIVNMFVAEAADAPVVLVGDIDRGGVFAQFVGTMDLLEDLHRRRVAAFLFNKFRGDTKLLAPGLDYLANRFRIPTLGVIPYIDRLRIADEDSVALDERRTRRRGSAKLIDIAVIRLPHISNYDDFLALEHEPGVLVRFVESAVQLNDASLVIIPGSKSTIADLGWLRDWGFAAAIVERVRRSQPVIGICGGCQMLGEAIDDPEGVESSTRRADGLGLLPLRTSFEAPKITAQTRVRNESPSVLTGGIRVAGELAGYEIHMGRVAQTRSAAAPFRVVRRNGAAVDVYDGAVSENGAVAGTMQHGIFENDALRDAMLRGLRERAGLPAPAEPPIAGRDTEYDRLARIVGENIDLAALARITGIDL